MTKDTIGVDISKDQLDAHRMSNGAKRRFTNDTVGHRALMGWLGQTETIHDMRVVYEPTGPYHRAFERRLDVAGAALVKVNPRQARRFAEATGEPAKTDRITPQCLRAWEHSSNSKHGRYEAPSSTISRICTYATVEAKTAPIVQPQLDYCRHARNLLTHERGAMHGGRVYGKEDRIGRGRQQTLLLQLMPPGVNLLPAHIVPMGNLRDRRTVEPNRHDNIEFLRVTPPPPPFLTKNFDASHTSPKTRR